MDVTVSGVKVIVTTQHSTEMNAIPLELARLGFVPSPGSNSCWESAASCCKKGMICNFNGCFAV